MVVVAFLVPLALLVRSVARDRALTAAERDAEAMSPVLAVTSTPDSVAGAVAATRSGREERLAVFLPEGQQVGAPLTVPAESLELARTGSAFFAGAGDGRLYLLPILGRAGTSVVVVSIPEPLLTEGVARSWAILAALGVGLVLIAVVVADRLGASVTGPVRDLSGAARRLGTGDLEVRVEPGGPPEVAAVGAAFNFLAGRVRELLAAERESVADLSHRLRTPLAVLRLQAEALPPGQARERLVEASGELELAVSGIIGEARRPVRNQVPATSDLGAVAGERAEFWGVLADEQHRPWTAQVAGNGPHLVSVAAEDLEAALDVLLGNIFTHTPEGCGFSVTVEPAPGGDRRLTVTDAGPGLPPGDVAERGRSGAGSTGLGLDIARRTAEQAGGTFTAGPGPDGTGTSIVLTFPHAEGPAVVPTPREGEAAAKTLRP
jgi:signal transduction histidine kinase